MLKDKLLIFKIYKVLTRKKTVIITIIKVFFNCLDFFDEIVKTYFELQSI